MDAIILQIRQHPFFEGFPETLFEGLTICAQPVSYAADTPIYRMGDAAEAFFLIQGGRVALEMHAPARGNLTVQTIDPGGVLGWSWLFPPYRRQFDARAVTPVTALALEAACLRRQSEDNHHLGHELYRRFSRAVVSDLQATRIQLLDIYIRPAPRRECFARRS